MKLQASNSPSHNWFVKFDDLHHKKMLLQFGHAAWSQAISLAKIYDGFFSSVYQITLNFLNATSIIIKQCRTICELKTIIIFKKKEEIMKGRLNVLENIRSSPFSWWDQRWSSQVFRGLHRRRIALFGHFSRTQMWAYSRCQIVAPNLRIHRHQPEIKTKNKPNKQSMKNHSNYVWKKQSIDRIEKK